MSEPFNIEREIRNFHALVKTSRELYESTKEVACPFFGTNVALTSDGFNHLLHKPNRQPRNVAEQRLKLRLLKKALQILERAGTVQEYRARLEKDGKPGRDGFSKTKNVEYWGFHDIVGTEVKILVRVVVRRVGDGKFHFWSVMPIGKLGRQKFYQEGMEDT